MIIGAGPAGLNCANRLIGENKDVLILEKNDIIGPKICAGGLTGRDLGFLNIPEYLYDKKFNEMTIHTQLNKTVIRSLPE